MPKKTATKSTAASVQAIAHGPLPLIETATPVILDMLISNPRTAPMILTRLGDTTAIVAPGRLDEFVERLKKIGQLPKVI